MNRLFRAVRRIGAVVVAVLVSVSLTSGVTASAAVPPGVSPIADRPSSSVTADALPTVQIDGVVWSQAIVGNTVYAGGEFTNARPAGAAPGTQLTPRTNLLAYNLSTGELITSFDPVVNGTIKSVVASPDGSRIYIGGGFTSVNGFNHYRIAAFDTATGQVVNSFLPGVDATVNSLSVTNTTVYAGGIFGAANGSARTRLAAFSASTGKLLAWSPTVQDTVDDAADQQNVVNAVQLTPDGKYLIVGGAFTAVNGAPALGLASVSATTGALVPFAANQVVQNYGKQGAILSLSTDGTSIYGTGYTYGSPSNFEGVFSAAPDTGTINWLVDCHGDSYGAYASGSQVYVVSHEHYCANIGGFPDTNPRNAYYRSTAFTTRATGTVQTNGEVGGGYGDFAGQPSPSLINWFPDLAAGTYTGQTQAAWTVTGNGKYVVEGGEFPTVNGIPQQGLVRFAVPSLAPNKRGPMDTAADTTTPSAIPISDTAATVTWPANWDQDNDTLTYRLVRDGTTVDTTTAVSQFWNRPTLTFTDTKLFPGTTYTYVVYATDPDGNTVQTAPTTVSTRGTPPTPTTTTITGPNAKLVAGQHVVITASVSTADGTPADGDVSASIDGATPRTGSLTAGAAQLDLGAMSAGTHTVTVDFTGTIDFAVSRKTLSVTVGRDATAVSAVVSPAKPVTGQRFSVRSSVRTAAPGTTAATGAVTVSVDGKAVAPTTLRTTAGTTALAGLRAGRHTITVRYGGDTDHATSTVSRTITVAAGRSTARVTSSAPHASRHKLVHFHAYVRAAAPAAGQPAGSVVFYVDGHRRATRTLHAGTATWSVRLPKGHHRVTVRYVGSSTFTASTSKAVKQRET